MTGWILIVWIGVMSSHFYHETPVQIGPFSSAEKCHAAAAVIETETQNVRGGSKRVEHTDCLQQ